MPATFDDFFRAATATEQNPDGNTPYDYQRRLAGDTAGRPCESQFISIPPASAKPQRSCSCLSLNSNPNQLNS